MNKFIDKNHNVRYFEESAKLLDKKIGKIEEQVENDDNKKYNYIIKVSKKTEEFLEKNSKQIKLCIGATILAGILAITSATTINSNFADSYENQNTHTKSLSL